MLLFFLPGIGILIYFTFGVNVRKNKLYKDKQEENKKLRELIKDWTIRETRENQQDYSSVIGDKQDLVTLLLRDSFSPLTDSNKVELLINGENKFPLVFDELEKAEKFIHLEYYIYENDEVGNRLKDILIRKAKTGVTVRFIYDDFGSHKINRNIVIELRKAGVQVFPFYKIKFFFLADRYNYRDHRKIIIVDGKVGFLGGINVSDRYINTRANKLYWRDTHLKIEGEAVYSLQYLFLSNWNFCCDERPEISQDFFPRLVKDENSQLVQITASGPDSERPGIMLSYFTAISTAKKELFLTSPYFIPGESILDAIRKAALSGVDVRILIPGISDSTIVNLASHSYYTMLLECGVRIFQYKKGFVHAKTMVVDDSLSIVGTANMDLRSFDLNFEAIAIVYDEKINAALKSAFMEDLHESEEIIAADWARRSTFTQLMEASAKLISPIL